MKEPIELSKEAEQYVNDVLKWPVDGTAESNDMIRAYIAGATKYAEWSLYKIQMEENDARIKQLDATLRMILLHVPNTPDYDRVRNKVKAVLNSKSNG